MPFSKDKKEIGLNVKSLKSPVTLMGQVRNVDNRKILVLDFSYCCVWTSLPTCKREKFPETKNLSQVWPNPVGHNVSGTCIPPAMGVVNM